MKTVFMGTPEFAVESLKALIKNTEVQAVITQPDKPKNRGKKLLPTPVKEVAIENNIPVYQPEKIKDKEFIEFLKTIDADLFVVVAYGQILPEEILYMPKFNSINVHASLLPKYRGAAPIQWVIINGEKTTGVTIMYMEKGLDCGDILLKKEVEIGKNETYGELYEKLSKIGADLLIEALPLIENGQINPQKQDDSLSNYAPMIEKETRHINWNSSTNDVLNLIRGLNPAPTAFVYYNEEMFKIYNAERFVTESNGVCGEIIEINKKGFVVKTNDGAVLITQMQAKGGKRMNASDYMRGHKIELNVILN